LNCTLGRILLHYTVQVAAFQAPLLPSGWVSVGTLLRDPLRSSEAQGVKVLCAPEALLGGLADYAPDPAAVAITIPELADRLRSLQSSVALIVGFTERGPSGCLYNSAAVWVEGRVLGVARKIHPAIRRSVYTAETSPLVCTVGDIRVGILICYDSTCQELGQMLVGGGAHLICIPTNNGLPLERDAVAVARESRLCDQRLARSAGVAIIRADVAGENGILASCGSSGIVERDGTILASTQAGWTGLVTATVNYNHRASPNAA
jgi:predicted amidohydrolase